MPTLKTRRVASALALGCVLAACLPGNDEAETGRFAAEPLSAHDCWLQHVGPALDGGVPDSADWPPECAAFLDRILHGPCAEAIARTCGVDDACATAPACAAVWLMAEFDDGAARCQAALDDPARYPDCHAANDCDALVERTCGVGADGGAPCLGQPACAQALLLQTDAQQGGSVAVCTQALQEGSLYPRCAR